MTDRQARFIREYLLDGNAGRAAIRSGYSAKNAARTGAELLKNARIRAALDAAADGPRAGADHRDPAGCAGDQPAGDQPAADRLEENRLEEDRRARDVLRDIRDAGRAAREEGNLKTALKAYELEGRHLGMFRDKPGTEAVGLNIVWGGDAR